MRVRLVNPPLPHPRNETGIARTITGDNFENYIGQEIEVEDESTPPDAGWSCNPFAVWRVTDSRILDVVEERDRHRVYLCNHRIELLNEYSVNFPLQSSPVTVNFGTGQLQTEVYGSNSNGYYPNATYRMVSSDSTVAVNTGNRIVAASSVSWPSSVTLVDSGKYTDIDNKKAEEKAKNLGCRIVYPSPEQLLIDIDDATSYTVFLRRIEEIKQFLPNVSWTSAPSRSGKPDRYHVYVNTGREISPIERIFLQLLLGSDPIREMLSWARMDNGNLNPTLFFEKQEEEEIPIRSIELE